MLELVGLDPDRADRQLRKYSKGMLQRIGIAQALVNFYDQEAFKRGRVRPGPKP